VELGLPDAPEGDGSWESCIAIVIRSPERVPWDEPRGVVQCESCIAIVIRSLESASLDEPRVAQCESGITIVVRGPGEGASGGARDRPLKSECCHAIAIQRSQITSSRGGAESGVRIFSGIQPTGRKHLGNYIGAITQYVAGQERGEGIFCIVDLHATTLAYEPGELRERTYDTTAILLAAGLDPARCTLFRQSDVPEHAELCWLLSTVTELGRLQRMHQFRDKSLLQRELVPAALLFYPVLQAADVLAYRAHEVPVGEDQREHLELMRDVARRFNVRFGDGEEVLVVPEHRIPEVGARIMDLQDPVSKMSTTGGSDNGTVYVLDPPAAIVKKLKSAVTDSGSEIRRAPEKPGVSNLIEILAAVRAVDPGVVESEFADARYGDFKAAVANALVDYLAPVRERYEQLREDEAALESILADGAQRAHAMAAETLSDVREHMGVGAPRRNRQVR
jgi:tryptophanyl-tRNA synthetase